MSLTRQLDQAFSTRCTLAKYPNDSSAETAATTMSLTTTTTTTSFHSFGGSNGDHGVMLIPTKATTNVPIPISDHAKVVSSDHGDGGAVGIVDVENDRNIGNDSNVTSLSSFVDNDNDNSSPLPNILNLSPHNCHHDVDNYGGIIARPFKAWPSDVPLPCVPSEKHWSLPSIQRSPSHEGFLMIKGMKTGGSTAAGINMRIARNVARRYHHNNNSINTTNKKNKNRDIKNNPEEEQRKQETTSFKTCKMRNDHASAVQMEYGQRDHLKSFLWTMIRDPTKRATSQFFHFQVSRAKTEPTDANFQKWLFKEQQIRHYYLRILSMTKQLVFDPTAAFDPIQTANDILQEYNFIGITERFDESVVALQMLLGLQTSDVIHINAKMSGGFDDGANDANQGCVYIVPSFVSPGMQEFFETNTAWRKMVEYDELLYQAANKSLDLTIEHILGRENFEQQLEQFRHVQQHVKDVCLPQIVFPCSAGGFQNVHPTCYWADSGCGMACIDSAINDLDLIDYEKE